MAKTKDPGIPWLPEPEEHDYPAAASYLGLLYEDAEVDKLVTHLRAAPMTRFKAKDIFRASGLGQKGISNAHVERDTDKIKEGTPLSPLLLVRDGANGKVVIADGYHRLCAIYGLNEDCWIPCKIV